APAFPPGCGDRRAGAGRRGPRPVHRARRPLPGGAGPAGGRRAGERRSLYPAPGPHRRAGAPVRQDDRRRLSRELHDETAQVFSAVKMELAVLRDGVPPAHAARLEQALALIDTGIRSIRSVTNDLRPSLLDDLGLLPALRSLVADFGARGDVRIELAAPAALPPLSKEAELALFR